MYIAIVIAKQFLQVACAGLDVGAGVIELAEALDAEVLCRDGPEYLHDAVRIRLGARCRFEVAFAAGHGQQTLFLFLDLLLAGHGAKIVVNDLGGNVDGSGAGDAAAGDARTGEAKPGHDLAAVHVDAFGRHVRPRQQVQPLVSEMVR